MKTFEQVDAILPILKLPIPCLVKVIITDKYVILNVGPRDWQWDIENGTLVGCGAVMDPLLVETALTWRNGTPERPVVLT